MSSGSSSRVSPGRYLTGQSAPQRVSGAGSPGGRLAGHGDVVFASLLLQQDLEHLRLVAGLVRTPPRHRATVAQLQVDLVDTVQLEVYPLARDGLSAEEHTSDLQS